MIFGDLPLEMSAHHYYLEDFENLEKVNGDYYNGKRAENRHDGDLIERDFTLLNINHKQMGVGGDNSWGAKTWTEYRLTKKKYNYNYTIVPIEGRPLRKFFKKNNCSKVHKDNGLEKQDFFYSKKVRNNFVIV